MTTNVQLPNVTSDQVDAALAALGLTELYEQRRIMRVELTPVVLIVTVDYSEDEGPDAFEEHVITISAETVATF